jgi:hypothetical protein
MKKNLILLMYIFPVLVGVVTYKYWLTGSIFSYSDWPYYQIDALVTNGQLSVWASWLNFGYFDNLTFWRKPIQIMYQFLTVFGFRKETSDIFLAFLPIIVINPIISTFTIYKLTGSKMGATVGSLFFNFNTYFLALNSQGHLYLTISSSIAFLTLYLFITNIKRNGITSILIMSLLSTLVGLIDFRNLYILIGMFSLFLLFDSLIHSTRKNLKQLKQTFLNFLTIIVLITLLNAFWLLIQIATSTFISNSITARGMVFSGFFDITKTFSVMHPFWTGNEIIWFTENSVPPHFMIIPIISLAALSIKNTKINLFFGILALIGVFLSKQSSYPFTSVYEYLFEHVPGFNAFREASKFYLFTVIGYSVLIGTFISTLELKWNQRNKMILMSKKSLIMTVIVIICWNTKPLIFESVKSLMLPVENQKEYNRFNEEIVNSEVFSRILWIPGEPKWSTYNNNHPKISFIDVIFTSWKAFRNDGDDSNFDSEKSILALISNPAFNQLLDNSSISYVAIPTDYVESNLDIFIDRDLLKEKLSSLSFLEQRIDLSIKDLVVYYNYNSKPHMYLTNSEESIQKSQDYVPVKFQFVSTSHYNMTIQVPSDPVFLNFSEAYHPDWKLRVGEFNWLQSLIQKDYYYPDKYHFESDIGLNHWKIDPKWFKDKGYQVDEIVPITLYFAPQAWMNLGLIISGSTFIIILGFLVYFTIKKYEKK